MAKDKATPQRKSKSQRLLDVAERNDVKAFIPEQRHVDIAEERTGGMVTYFWEATRRISFMAAYDYVQRLANSAYLQGVNDAAVAMAILREGRNER